MFGFLKFLGGIALAILGFLGMIFAIGGFFVGKIQEALQSTPFITWPLIVIGGIAFIMFVAGVYILRHDP